jgi:hypothetical protein
MRHSFKIATIAASFALILMPVMASAQVHSHPSRHTVVNRAQAALDRDNAAFEAYYAQRPRVEQPAQPSCGSNCQPMQMYGIGY